MKNMVLFLLLVSILFVAPIVAGEERPTAPPYQGPPGGYGSPGTPDNIPPGMPSPMPIRPPQRIPLPPPIVFAAPPEVIVIPETYVYVLPDVEVDLFFWNGWWWRLWEGRWYRSRFYNRGWGYYDNVPSFYFDIDPGWRRHYRDHDWYGHRWNYERIPYPRLQQNWKGWQDNRRWERRGTWGVQNYQPRPKQQRMELRQQWQQQYHQRPEVQQHQQWRQQQRQPEVQKPQHSQPRGKTERGEIEKQDRK